ncbi:unnamed protein product [Lepeophtheirus salmonis]|uniref:(salmon louse) hypothetical protein n=1 Tax=Lepeophtheirus salmonis TaxID=72036 RepID=A0A7R8CV06_LEPSM|nr:unnamed protein product [Lepeophtheirus salmonis]CAF2889916.1 unnamed protein product [Lepeophtheirus salmonis]
MGDEGEKNEDEKDVELDLMAEQEYLRLTRQFRVMEGDKEAYEEEANKALRRQRKIITDFEKEKNDRARVLNIIKSKTNCRKEDENASRIMRLAEEQENLLTSIMEEKVVVQDLNKEIRRIEKQIAQQRKTLKGVSNSIKKPSIVTSSFKDISQRIVLLENRLDGVMVGFNAVLSQNAKLRTDIDHLVQERSTFNDLIGKLQKRISTNKKMVYDITEMSIQAFDQRDESQSKIAALKEKNEKDAAQCVGELKELQRNLDHDEKLKDFLFQKSNERIFNAMGGLRGTGEEEKELSGKKNAAGDEVSAEMILKYRQAFDKIKHIVGNDSTLDKIVADFIKVEDQNFALFNYVTEMNNQVEGLQENISRLKNDIKEAKGRGDERERHQREQLEMMEEKLKTSTYEAETTETKLSLMESVINKLKLGAEVLYNVSDCRSTPILCLMNGKDLQTLLEKETSFINENNIIMYLDIIYERVVELKGIEQYMDLKGRRSSIGTSQAALRKIQAIGGIGKSGVANVPHQETRKLSKLLTNIHSFTEDGFGGEKTTASAALVEDQESRPFDMSALKARALAISQREKREDMNLRKMGIKGDLSRVSSGSKKKGLRKS